MDLTSQSIYDAALRLSEEDRLELAVHLLDSLPEDAGMLSFNDPNLLEELERRSADKEAQYPGNNSATN